MMKNALIADARRRGLGLDGSGTPQRPVRSEATQKAYAARGRGLVSRYREEEQLPDDTETPWPAFGEWLRDHVRPTLSAASWRQYRASAAVVLEAAGHEELAGMLDVPTEATVSPPKRTSARKPKRFPADDLERTVTYLKTRSRSAIAPSLVDWLVAGAATGLRPSEWRAAALQGDRLYVLNAKRSNGRSNGFVRTLDVSGLRPETLEAVKRMIIRGREWHETGRWEDMQRQHAHMLPEVTARACSGRRYTLYSLRHQFVANAKARHAPSEVSALAGHIVDHTATYSYGRKRSAWKPRETLDVAVPVPEEVATVRRGHRALSKEDMNPATDILDHLDFEPVLPESGFQPPIPAPRV